MCISNVEKDKAESSQMLQKKTKYSEPLKDGKAYAVIFTDFISFLLFNVLCMVGAQGEKVADMVYGNVLLQAFKLIQD